MNTASCGWGSIRLTIARSVWRRSPRSTNPPRGEPQAKLVQYAGKNMAGIGVRTTHAGEVNPGTSRVGALCRQFDGQVTVDYKHGARVYGVYYHDESDFEYYKSQDEIEIHIVVSE